MKIQNIFLLLLLLSLQSLYAKNPSESITMPRMVYQEEFSCNLPAPSSLNINSVGSNSVQVSWSPVFGAVQYRLQAFDVLTGDGLGTAMFVSGTTNSATVSTVGSTGSAYVRIWSVCNSGEYEVNNFTQSDSFDTIIIDIVVTGIISPPTYIATQTVTDNPTTSADISWTGGYEYFHVQYNSVERWFKLNVKSNSSPDVVNIYSTANTGERIIYTLEMDNQHHAVSLQVRFRANVNLPENDAEIIATLKATYITANGSGKFYKSGSNNNSGCTIYKAIPSAPPPIVAPGSTTNGAAERDELPSNSSQLSARPNPFRNTLTVQLPETKDPNGTVMHLYDLLGARRMTYEVPANQTECTLNTNTLEPGVYFLRIESDGKMETVKLIKTL